MNDLSKDAVNRLAVDEAGAGQRVDNFLLRVLKGVPKSHIYRILRSGEVRVNRLRVKPDVRLVLRDELRIPPTRNRPPAAAAAPPAPVRGRRIDRRRHACRPGGARRERRGLRSDRANARGATDGQVSGARTSSGTRHLGGLGAGTKKN